MAMYDCDIHPPGVVPDNMRESIRNRGDIDSARCMGFDEMGRHYWSVMEVANDPINRADVFDLPFSWIAPSASVQSIVRRRLCLWHR